ncbi:MAG: exo-alpha-sialidase [candidate division WOR-3 bacterium]
MKKANITLLIIISLSILYGQWEPDRRLTFFDTVFSVTSYNNAWCVASSGNFVHVVCYAGTGIPDRWDVFYIRSTDNGVNWEELVKLSEGPRTFYRPAVAVSGPYVHCVWTHINDRYIYYRRSTDNGESWEEVVQIEEDRAISAFPSIAAFGSNVHIVWVEGRDGRYEIYYKLSTDNGLTWGEDTRLTFHQRTAISPSVAAFGPNVHVVWEDYRDCSYRPEIYYKRSTDNGLTWGEDTRLTFDSASSRPSIAVSGSNVHIVWQWYDWEVFRPRIYYKRSTDNGTTWSRDTCLTESAGIGGGPSIAVSGSNVHIVWRDSRDGNLEIYYKRSTDNGVTWSEDTRLTSDSAESNYTSVAVSGPCVHCVWEDYRSGLSEIYYKRNPTGNPSIGERERSLTSQNAILENPYPNPFRKSTTIYLPPTTDRWKLEIYDTQGRLVKSFPAKEVIVWDGKDEGGKEVPKGVYLFCFTSSQYKGMKKVVKL